MGILWAIAGVVLGLAVAGALLALVPVQGKQEAADSTDRTGHTGRSVSLYQRVRQRLQQRRLLVAIYLGIVAVTVFVLVVGVLPSLLTEHPPIPNSVDRYKAIADTRTGLVAMLAAIGAAGGLAYTARTYRLSREGQLTDRYSKAVALLGDEKIEVRLGGIYALERLMRDSPADQPTIMDTLAGFVRQHAPPTPQTVLPGRGTPPSAPDHPAEDVQAVLTVLRRRHPVPNERPIDLQRTNLTGADLSGATLTRAQLGGATLTRANLYEATLTRADLSRATLTRANLYEATLTDANLSWATLTDADLSRATLTGAALGLTNLTGADLGRANLTGADLGRANLTDANLGRTNLINAVLGKLIRQDRPDLDEVGVGATLTGAQLGGATLTGADLGGATLTDADLSRATLTGGSLSEQQLASARHTNTISWIENPPQPPHHDLPPF